MNAELKEISEIGVPKAQGEPWAEAAERLQTDTNDTITNALEDLETAAKYVEQDGTEYDAKMIRACVDTLREELGDE